MEVKLVIFDFDGTLADTRNIIVATLQDTMRQLNLSVADEDTCASTIGIPLKAGFKQIFPMISDEMAENCVKVYRTIFNKNLKLFVPELFPGVETTLQELTNHGYSIAIASSRTSTSLNAFIKEMGISKYISCVIGAEDVINAKPHPDPVIKALSYFGISANNALVVGDMPVDIQMGKAAGTRTCGVSYGNSTILQLQEVGADFVISDIRQLAMILKP